jgi:hypothetical protein
MEPAHLIDNIRPFYPRAFPISSFPSLRSTRGFGLNFQAYLVSFLPYHFAIDSPDGTHSPSEAFCVDVCTGRVSKNRWHNRRGTDTFTTVVLIGSEILYKESGHEVTADSSVAGFLES